jgi:hypothetical protein
VSDLATRYGTPNANRRRLLVSGVAALALVFVGWVAWAALFHGDPEVTSDLVSYDVVDEHTATDHATVGELNVRIAPGGDRVQTLSKTVRTEREATTVDVVGCVAEGQKRPR